MYILSVTTTSTFLPTSERKSTLQQLLRVINYDVRDISFIEQVFLLLPYAYLLY